MPCNCSEHRAKLEGHSVKANLLASEIRTEVYDGKATMVVPVVMARADVVMNGGLFPVQEMLAEAWNGVPVTVHHPMEGSSFISANASPDALAEWHIGRIFNARVDGVKLVGEAWIDTARANSIAPGLIKTIRGNRPLDVSVGFYSRDEEQEGELGGKPYQVINRDVIPNHLALLPNEQGACSWKDGCGVRSNLKRNRKMPGKVTTEKLASIAETVKTALGLKAKIELPQDEDGRRRMMTALGKVFKTNERSSDDDRRQIIADLVSSDDSPFLADDLEALSMLSPETLTRMKEEYLADLNAEEEPPAEKKPEDEKPDEKPKEDDVAAKTEMPKTPEALQSMITAAVKASQPDIKAIVKAAVDAAAASMLTPEHKAALVVASKVAGEQRTALIARIVTLSTMEQAAVEKLDNATLELIANGLHPTPNYSGRVINVNEGDDEDLEIKAMTAGADMVEQMKAKGKPNGKAAA